MLKRRGGVARPGILGYLFVLFDKSLHFTQCVTSVSTSNTCRCYKHYTFTINPIVLHTGHVLSLLLVAALVFIQYQTWDLALGAEDMLFTI